MPDFRKPPTQKGVAEALRYKRSHLGVLFAWIIEYGVETATLTEIYERLPRYMADRYPYIPVRIRGVTRGAAFRSRIRRAIKALRQRGLAAWIGRGKYRFFI